MNYNPEEEVISMLTVWDFVSRWWWFWFGSMVVGAIGITVFSLATVQPPGGVYSSNAILITSNRDSTAFYGAIANMWLAEHEAVSYTTASSDVVIELELQLEEAVAQQGLNQVITEMIVQGQLLRDLQITERLDEARRLAEFTGMATSLVDPGYLAPSLGTITVIQEPSYRFTVMKGPNHTRRAIFAALFMLTASSGASLVLTYAMKLRQALQERKGVTE